MRRSPLLAPLYTSQNNSISAFQHAALQAACQHFSFRVALADLLRAAFGGVLTS
jgi:hypothetical protein